MNKPNAHALAMRDPALAALIGAIPADFGSEFGYGADHDGAEPDMMNGEFGAEFGDLVEYGWGAEFGAAPPPAHPASPAAKALAAARYRAAHTDARERLLEPNKYSATKVERYVFAINQALTLGTALGSFTTLFGQPDTTIRPQRVTMNAPSMGFCLISEIKVANVSVQVGGTTDAFEFSPLAVGSHLDMPTISPANKATVLGNYTGFVPPGFSSPNAYTFVVSFKGPSAIVA